MVFVVNLIYILWFFVKGVIVGLVCLLIRFINIVFILDLFIFVNFNSLECIIWLWFIKCDNNLFFIIGCIFFGGFGNKIICLFLKFIIIFGVMLWWFVNIVEFLIIKVCCLLLGVIFCFCFLK